MLTYLVAGRKLRGRTDPASSLISGENKADLDTDVIRGQTQK